MNSAKSIAFPAPPTSAVSALRLNQGSDAFGSLLALCLPFAFLYEAGFIGQMYGTELLLILMLPFIWLASPAPLSRPVRSTLWLLAAWLVALVATDIYRGSYIGDYLRGWAKLIFFAIDIYALAKLLKTERRVLLWCVGWNCAFAISTWRTFEDFPTRWKFGIGIASLNVVVGLALLFWHRRHSVLGWFSAFLSLAAAVASLFLNARNTFLSLTLSALLLAIAATPELRRRFLALCDRYSVLVVIGAVVAVYAAGYAYVEGASAGVFGNEARQKLEDQQSDAADPVLGALAGGRDEFYSSTAAIADSPIVGYGSWAHSAYYYNIFVEQVHAHGTPDQIKTIDSTMFVGEPLIPTHSHVLGAWVEAGIVGALFWLFVMNRALKATRRAIEFGSPAAVLVLLNSAALIWNVLFSPFGGEMRLVIAFTLVLFLYVLDSRTPSSAAEPPTEKIHQR